MKPYSFQSENIADVRAHFQRRVKSVLWYLPTGGGKSTAAAWMIQEAVRRGKICWFLVHRRELLRQVERLFREMGIDYGIIASGYDAHPECAVQICSMGTLSRRIGKFSQRPDLAILDECHHVACESWSSVLAQLGDGYRVGLSASPIRLDGRGLGKYFGALVKGPSVRELIDKNYLSPFKTYAPPTVDTSGLHVRAGDYVVSEAADLMDKPAITGSAVAEYEKLCAGKRAIVFCVSIEHSKHVAEQFRSAGHQAVHFDGTFADSARDGIIADFERGAIKILCNVDLCGEGLSINAIECVVLLRPTQSLGLYIQTVGRGLRTWPGKSHLTILDHVGLCTKFGLIDEPREWSLEGEDKKKTKKSTAVKVCPSCFCALSPRAQNCTECGYTFTPQPREVEERDGELREITAEELAKRRARVAQGRAQSLEELRELGRSKGYRPGWAERVWAAREAKRGARTKIMRDILESEERKLFGENATP